MDLMVIDTSAFAAILVGEPDAEHFVRTVADAPLRLLSAVTSVELSSVIEGRKGYDFTHTDVRPA